MQEETTQGNQGNTLSIPIAIVVAGVLIAGAVFLTRGGTAPTLANPGSGKEVSVKPVTSADHILGNPNAKVMIVEYSDLECPFCKSFHATLQQVMKEYGASGEVAWVFRHFPLEQLHSKAPKEAEATECAAEQGGNEAFWKYTDALIAITPANNGLDLAQLPVIAKSVGLDEKAFTTCLNSGKYTAKIAQAYEDGIAAGGNGTPYTILISGKQQVPISGAQPLSALRLGIDSLLK